MIERPRDAVTAALLSVVGALAGCAATPTAELQQARSSYQAAARDPHVPTYAPVALRDAEQALRRAEDAAGNDRDSVPHLAYIAQQRVDIARAQAQKAMATKRVDELAQQRDEVLLQARGQRAAQAQQQVQQAEQAAFQAQQRAERLEQELRDLQAKETERGTEISLPDVLFAVNRAELKPGALLNMRPLIDYLRDNPDRDLLIEGHTDASGSDEHNLELSQARAAAVRDFFIAQGIAPERLTIQGYGERFPVAPNDNAAGRQENRRVNIVVLKEGQSARQVLR